MPPIKRLTRLIGSYQKVPASKEKIQCHVIKSVKRIKWLQVVLPVAVNPFPEGGVYASFPLPQCERTCGGYVTCNKALPPLSGDLSPSLATFFSRDSADANPKFFCSSTSYCPPLLSGLGLMIWVFLNVFFEGGTTASRKPFFSTFQPI